MKRVLIIAGETSGDLHGSALMKSMKSALPEDISFRGIGGTLMIREGLDALRHVREMNFMGFAEVIRRLPFIRRTMNELRSLLDTWRPDLVILIDYPGFNLKFAPYPKRRNIPVMYFISPQLWAWHTGRVRQVRRFVDRMVVLFDFERDFYRRYGIEADFVGHPLVETTRPALERAEFLDSLGIDGSAPIIGLFPGSRLQEIIHIFPVMADSICIMRERWGNCVALLGCAGDIDDIHYARFSGRAGIIPVRDRTYDIMAHSDVLVVTSGTATLEAGIIGTPMVIVYRTSGLTYHIGKALVNIPDIGLINIVAGSRIVPELSQDEVTPENIADHLDRFLRDDGVRSEVRASLRAAKAKLGGPGASSRAAAIAVEMMKAS